MPNVSTFKPHTRHFIRNVLDEEFGEAEALLGKQHYIVADRNSGGETALHWLAIENELEGVRLLLRHGADPNARDLGGNMILADVASLGCVEVAQTLIEAGADVQARHPIRRETALHIAARHTPDPTTVTLLLDAGAELDVRDEFEGTPLHTAAEFDKRAVAELLLGRGADPAAVDDCGKTFVDKAPQEHRSAWEALRDAALARRPATDRDALS